jgi:hypothetical protein
MPDAKERAMEYNLSTFNFLCKKLDVHPIALASIVTEGKIWHNTAFTSMDDHEKCQEYLRRFLQEMDTAPTEEEQVDNS